MPKKPFFSIVIPTYNRAQDLQFALYCLFRQTFVDFEVVISDNYSNDDTKTVVANIKDKRIRYFRLGKTVANAINFKNGIKQAKGKYVFLHSDDDFLLYVRSLEEIYNQIINLLPGYVRINYVSLSLDKKRIFYFKLIKRFTKNEHLPSSSDSKKILTFILDSDPYFISGMIFRNKFTKDTKIIDSDPLPCIEILFDVMRNFGAYYIAKPHIAATWSRRKLKKKERHHFYILIDGKLRFEQYLEAVKRKVNTGTYALFLHRELINLCVLLFPAMKTYVGNKEILQISSRICLLDRSMRKNVTFWICLMVALLLPGFILKVIRDTFLNLYSKYSQVEGGDQIYATIKNLELEYATLKTLTLFLQ